MLRSASAETCWRGANRIAVQVLTAAVREHVVEQGAFSPEAGGKEYSALNKTSSDGGEVRACIGWCRTVNPC